MTNREPEIIKSYLTHHAFVVSLAYWFISDFLLIPILLWIPVAFKLREFSAVFYHPHSVGFISYIFPWNRRERESERGCLFSLGTTKRSWGWFNKSLKKIADFNSFAKKKREIFCNNHVDMKQCGGKLLGWIWWIYSNVMCFLLYDYIWSDYIYFNFSQATFSLLIASCL